MADIFHTEEVGMPRGACSHICATESILVSGKNVFVWKGYGFKMHIPENALPAGKTECVVHLAVTLPTIKQFDLPDNAIPVSAFYDISAPSGFGPVIVEIQHCVCTSQGAALSFVMSTDDMPFEYMKGGELNPENRSYGRVQVEHFSKRRLALVSGTPRCYCAQLFYETKEHLQWLLHFTITCDLEVCKTALEKHFAKLDAKSGPYQAVKFEDKVEEISLVISCEGVIVQNGWYLLPLTHPGITKEQIDNYQCNKWIPCCQIQVEWIKTDERPTKGLKHRINLEGAKPPYNYFMITCEPSQTYKQPESHQGKVPQQAVETEGCHAPIAEDVQLSLAGYPQETRSSPSSISRLLPRNSQQRKRKQQGANEVPQLKTQRLHYALPSSTAARGSETAYLRRGDRPEMWQLQKFVGMGGRVIRVVEEVSVDWEKLALALHFRGTVIRAVRENKRDVEAACRHILERWSLDGEGRQPATWETLVECLEDIEHGVLAENLRRELKP